MVDLIPVSLRTLPKMFSRPALIDVPFFITGTLKIAYDLVVLSPVRSGPAA